MKSIFTITINILFDPEASVYVATSEDMPGLVVEAETYELVQSEVEALIPQLFKDNAHLMDLPEPAPKSIDIDLLIHHKRSMELSSGRLL